MLNVLLSRLQQGFRTVAYPVAEPALPERFRGRPVLRPDVPGAVARGCVAGCPSGALRADDRGQLQLDQGLCLFCGACEAAVQFTREHRLAGRRREQLVIGPEMERLPDLLDAEARRLFGRSLKLRQVSAGGCNACEADTSVLNTVVFDLARFGIQFVAGPRHADGILVTGPVPENMREALYKTYEAVPAPKLVIAVGACAVAGGPYREHPEVHNGVDCLLPVDLYVPGCPPHPYTILDGLLRLLGRL